MTSMRQEVANCTKRKIEELKHMEDKHECAKILANYRCGFGKEPGEELRAWGECLHNIPESMFGNGKPTYAEKAIYNTMVLFAYHQQGYDIKDWCMHNGSQRFGTALAKLIQKPEDTDRYKKRMEDVALARDYNIFIEYIFTCTRLMKQKDISFDYVSLSKDLYDFQFGDDKAVSEIGMRIGQDFYKELNRFENAYNA